MRLLEPIKLQDGTEIPAGFECDLDTVPRELGALFAWFKGRATLAAIVHDWRYQHRFNRRKADKEFLAVMAWEGVRKRYRIPIYWAVRIFGGLSYPD